MKTELKTKKDVYDFLYQVKTFLGLNKKRFSEENLNLIFNVKDNEEIINTEQKHNILESFFDFCDKNKTLSIDDFLKEFSLKSKSNNPYKEELLNLKNKVKELKPNLDSIIDVNKTFLELIGIGVNYWLPTQEFENYYGSYEDEDFYNEEYIIGDIIVDSRITNYEKFNTFFYKSKLIEDNNDFYEDESFLKSLTYHSFKYIEDKFSKLEHKGWDVSYKLDLKINIDYKTFDFMSYILRTKKNRIKDKNLLKILIVYHKKIKTIFEKQDNEFEIDLFDTFYNLCLSNREDWRDCFKKNRALGFETIESREKLICLC